MLELKKPQYCYLYILYHFDYYVLHVFGTGVYRMIV